MRPQSATVIPAKSPVALRPARQAAPWPLSPRRDPARIAPDCPKPPAILNLHERIESKLFLNRTRKDSNFKRPHICATLFQIEKCCKAAIQPPSLCCLQEDP